MSIATRRLCAAALIAVALAPATAAAQTDSPMRVSPEVRVDAIFGSRGALQAGAGIQVPLGYYVRIGADAAAGLRVGTSPLGGARADGRVDLLGRFLLDPFRQSRYGFSAGAGLSTRFEHGERATPLLLVALELEGRRPTNGWVPALQLGLGGGARVGLVLRRGAPGAR